MKIDNKLVPLAYKLSLEVFQEKRSINNAVIELSLNDRMNRNSARDYINNFKHLIRGEKFTRTLNKFSMNYFLERIYDDFGDNGLSNAVEALKQHVVYYEDTQYRIKGKKGKKGIMRNMRELISKYSNKIIDQDIKEQDEIIKYLTNNPKSKLEILEAINSRNIFENQKTEIKISSYKRDNQIIAYIKYLRGFKCQICNISIPKRDGTKYIEAAHIVAKHKKGKETIDNIILLCPNHHKEFDLGNREIIHHNKEQVKFRLNGKCFEIKFIPENID